MSQGLAALVGKDERLTALFREGSGRALSATLATGEHVRGVARSLEDPQQFYNAQILARVAIENAGLVRWLLTSSDPTVLVGRYVGQTRHEQDYAIKFDRAALAQATESAEQIRQSLQENIEIKKRTKQWVAELNIKIEQKGPTALGNEGGTPNSYALYSAAVHGRSYEAISEMARTKPGDLFMDLVGEVAYGYVLAVDLLLTFMTGEGIPVAERVQIADKLGLKPESLQVT